MKKLFLGATIALVSLSLVGCNGNTASVSNVEGELVDLMVGLYEPNIKDTLPMVDAAAIPSDMFLKEDIAGFIGTDKFDFEEAYVSEPMMGSYAHSVVLIRVAEGVDVEEFKAEISKEVEAQAIYRKWICVGVEPGNVIVDSIGDLIILIMDDEHGTAIHENFKNLAN